MAKTVYPLNWVEPDPPDPIVLTPAQRDSAKTMMKNYINNQAKGFTYNELLHIAQNWIRNNTSKHVHDNVILEIIDEIYEEWKGTWTFLGS